MVYRSCEKCAVNKNVFMQSRLERFTTIWHDCTDSIRLATIRIFNKFLQRKKRTNEVEWRDIECLYISLPDCWRNNSQTLAIWHKWIGWWWNNKGEHNEMRNVSQVKWPENYRSECKQRQDEAENQLKWRKIDALQAGEMFIGRLFQSTGARTEWKIHLLFWDDRQDVRFRCW